jgi:hypothetical protein
MAISLGTQFAMKFIEQNTLTLLVQLTLTRSMTQQNAASNKSTSY